MQPTAEVKIQKQLPLPHCFIHDAEIIKYKLLLY